MMKKKEINLKVKNYIAHSPHRNNIKRVALFGSYAEGKQKRGSDVDILIEFQRPIGLFAMVGVQRELADALKKKVDLMTPGSLSKYFRDDVLRRAVQIYEKK